MRSSLFYASRQTWLLLRITKRIQRGWPAALGTFLIVALSLVQPRAANGAVIFVTTLDQKISSTGGCSLQEAIYSSDLHTSLDGVHGIAIDATDPDHFITTQCVAGTGNDTIVLPSGTTAPAMFQLKNIVDDAHNPLGPTATPIIFSNITIEANGATLVRVGGGPVANANFRAFAVGFASVYLPDGTTVSGTGNLTIRNAYIKGFGVKGGDGTLCGGGGGMGAGGAISVKDGGLERFHSCCIP